jgi:xanthine dehydrogenase small subunit
MQHYAAQLPKEQHSLVSAPFGDETGEADLVAQLQTLQSTQSLELATANARYFAPQTATEFANYLLEYPEARILAGGTDVGLWVTKQHRDLKHLVYIGAVTELAQITQNSEFLEIGAAVRLEQAYQALVKHYPELNDLYERFASLPIRNAGTLIGNVANGSPIGDSMPALIALGARVILQRGTEQRSLALEDFYLGYQQKDLQAGEFVRAVQVPLQTKAMVRTWKISKRFGQDISAVCAAFALELAAGKVKTIRLAFGGMAAIPKRATQTEQALLGQIWSEPLIEQAIQALQQDFQPLSDMRASAQYRQLVAANLLRKFYLEVTELRL